MSCFARDRIFSFARDEDEVPFSVLLAIRLSQRNDDACFSMWHLTPSNPESQIGSFRPPQDVHDRAVPLALWNTVNIDGDAYVAQYHGHGQTKVAHKLISMSGAQLHDRVLKVVCPPKEDPEVITMKHLNRSEAGICVQILREGHVSTR